MIKFKSRSDFIDKWNEVDDMVYRWEVKGKIDLYGNRTFIFSKWRLIE